MDSRKVSGLTAALAMPAVDLKILSLLGQLGPLTTLRLAEGAATTEAYLAIRLLRLLDGGLIVRCQVMSRPGADPVRPGWQIAPEADAALEKLASGFEITIDAMVAR